jgi:phosphohistidine phosphatase
MDVYLLRHGIAEEGNPGAPDSERALTPEGERKLREILRAAKTAGLDPALVLSSPYKRARQTAEVAVSELGYSGNVIETACLVPSARPEAVWEEIRLYKSSPALLLVSHEPLMSSTLAFLLGSPALRADFKKGSLARIGIEGFSAKPRGTLRWLLAPRLARGCS